VRDLHVVLVEPEIHWNTGNAGRTCLAVGAQLHLVRPLGFSLGEKEVRRAGLDYWARVNPTVWESWAELERTLPSLGTPLFFTSRSPRRFQEIAYPRPAVLIFGRESVGLPIDLLARRAEETVAIPMLDPELRSLNLSTSVALAAYEARRQWR
jgi:tRNA (cytidine/uridine-2'-O-)-methyltransferase